MVNRMALVQTTDRLTNQLQQNIKQVIDPIIAAPLVNGLLLKNITLAGSSNTVNHKLGRPLQGWIIVRQRATADVYDTQDANPTPALTLLLTASAVDTVDLYVF